MQIQNFPLIMIKDENGYYVECPLFDGCYSQGKTLEEAQKNIQEVIQMCVDELNTTRSFSLSNYLTQKTAFFSTLPMEVHV